MDTGDAGLYRSLAQMNYLEVVPPFHAMYTLIYAINKVM